MLIVLRLPNGKYEGAGYTPCVVANGNVIDGADRIDGQFLLDDAKLIGRNEYYDYYGFTASGYEVIDRRVILKNFQKAKRATA